MWTACCMETMTKDRIKKRLTCHSRGVRVSVRILHVLHQLLAIHEQFLALRAIDSVGAADQGRVLWERDHPSEALACPGTLAYSTLILTLCATMLAPSTRLTHTRAVSSYTQ